MAPDEITVALSDRFGSQHCQQIPPDAWQVDKDGQRLLVIISDPWVKLMIPIVPIAEAQSFIPQMMEANFDQTQEARYAFHQDVVWGIFQYDLAALDAVQFESAISRLSTLNANGVDGFFSQMVETQVTQIIVASKKQGKSLDDTLKTLDRFYAEGMMGDMSSQDGYQQNALSAWRRQLERLWPTVEIDS